MVKKKSKISRAVKTPPFETDELRKALKQFYETPYTDPSTGITRSIGSYKWGVYLFYDYDGEPIYVGQTAEKISGRIGRHLTNQRSDAIAMSVLDPFEVAEIEVYPLPEFEAVNSKSSNYKQAKAHLDALEYAVHEKAIAHSKFKAILNEKDPRKPKRPVSLPLYLRGSIVSDRVRELRAHSDVRLARRALIIWKLAQTISERQVQNGLRRTLITQAVRLRTLAERRFIELGGESTVEIGAESEGEEGPS